LTIPTVIAMRVTTVQEAGKVHYYVANWNSRLNAAVMHCGPFATEKEAWDWIGAITPVEEVV
jgi:hypothetical protein